MSREVLAGLVVAIAALHALAGSPAGAVSTAFSDVQKLPVDVRIHVRYLWQLDKPLVDEKTLLFQVNNLSREGDFGSLTSVGDGVYRVDLRDFGWDRDVWEKLSDPYFLDLQHPVNGDQYKEVEQEYGHFTDAKNKTGWVTTRKAKEKVKEASHSLYFPMGVWTGKDSAALVEATGSYVPIVRADWFFAQTAQQLNREGAGYYDFLGVKTRADIEDLAGLDRAKAIKRRREIAAVVKDSGVALNNRQIFRFNAVTGGWWETLDVDKSTGAGNALRLLDGDFKADANEVYYVLPNHLFGLAAVNAKDGKLQDTVPPNIASDKDSTSNDSQIHPGRGCIRCHSNGLKPIQDWARPFYSGGTNLQSPEYDVHKRLKQVYLTALEDLESLITDDVASYARGLKKLNGRTPQEQSSAYTDAFHAYSEVDVVGDQFAAELGCSRIVMIRAFQGYAFDNPLTGLDPILGGYLKFPEEPARREHLEEIFGTAAAIVQGVKK